MANTKNGDTVKIHYTGTLSDGEVFDSSKDRDPLQFTLGSGQVIPGFDEGVMGMAIGDKKTINIDAQNAYGPINPELVQQIKKTEFKEDMNLEKGSRMQLNNGQGQTMVVTVADIDENTVTLDGNHPLAGKDLTFELELVEIDEA